MILLRLLYVHCCLVTRNKPVECPLMQRSCLAYSGCQSRVARQVIPCLCGASNGEVGDTAHSEVPAMLKACAMGLVAEKTVSPLHSHARRSKYGETD